MFYIHWFKKASLKGPQFENTVYNFNNSMSTIQNKCLQYYHNMYNFSENYLYGQNGYDDIIVDLDISVERDVLMGGGETPDLHSLLLVIAVRIHNYTVALSFKITG